MSMTSFAILAAEGGGHESEWVLPMPSWAYGAMALAIFLVLLGLVWSFRNAGHTYMTQPDIVDHGHAPNQHVPGDAPGGHGSAH